MVNAGSERECDDKGDGSSVSHNFCNYKYFLVYWGSDLFHWIRNVLNSNVLNTHFECTN